MTGGRAFVKPVLALFAALLLASSPVHASGGTALKAGTFDPPRAAPDFTLAGSNGGSLKLSGSGKLRSPEGKSVLRFLVTCGLAVHI